MYKILCVFAALLALSGCSKPMSYEHVQKAKKYCESNGLALKWYTSAFSNTYSEINYVNCLDSNGRTYPVPNSVYK